MPKIKIELYDFRDLCGIHCEIDHKDVSTKDGYSFSIASIESLFYERNGYPNIPITLESEENEALITWLEEKIKEDEGFMQEVMEFNGVEMEPFLDGCKPYSGASVAIFAR